jgi:hypothetical protein
MSAKETLFRRVLDQVLPLVLACCAWYRYGDVGKSRTRADFNPEEVVDVELKNGAVTLTLSLPRGPVIGHGVSLTPGRGTGRRRGPSELTRGELLQGNRGSK